ncbi:Akt1 [Symbiodinium natans]|uniref:Akt1 protein n=1 Tax=Symbiodinium natans TaxID=878477 RepID=A0A812PLA1_9DINO|nr:Akt1 [Symbiodinium natans]
MAASELPAGCVVMEGWLMKRSQQLLQWRWRYVKLTSDQHLATFTSEQGDVLTNDVDIGGATAEATDFFLAAPVEFGFLVACRDKTLRFAAETAATREEWLRKIASIAGRESLDPEKDESPGFRRRDSPSSSILLQPLEEFVGEESPKAGSPGKGKGSKGPGKPGKGGPGKGPGKAPPKGKGKGPPVPGKGVPRLRTMPKASSLPLGRRLSVRMLNADQVAAFAPEKRDHASSSDDEPSPLNPAAVDLEAEVPRRPLGSVEGARQPLLHLGGT